MKTVSLFTREWIEISMIARKFSWLSRLPLYEGVDWNWMSHTRTKERCVSLFTREWIEIPTAFPWTLWFPGLPLYEGVDWNMQAVVNGNCLHTSPSLRGSGLKFRSCCVYRFQNKVSLFTREWIEIQCRKGWLLGQPCLPLYEGVDWNLSIPFGMVCLIQSPSLRGSGLK